CKCVGQLTVVGRLHELLFEIERAQLLGQPIDIADHCLRRSANERFELRGRVEFAVEKYEAVTLEHERNDDKCNRYFRPPQRENDQQRHDRQEVARTPYDATPVRAQHQGHEHDVDRGNARDDSHRIVTRDHLAPPGEEEDREWQKEKESLREDRVDDRIVIGDPKDDADERADASENRGNVFCASPLRWRAPAKTPPRTRPSGMPKTTHCASQYGAITIATPASSGAMRDRSSPATASAT